MITLVIATTAPSDVRLAAQERPAPLLSASASGASLVASCDAGRAPSAVTHTRM